MRKTILILAATVVAIPTFGSAAAEGEQRFVHEGSTYVYTRSVDNGHPVIEGHRYPGGEAFRFVVKGHRVTGTTGNREQVMDAYRDMRDQLMQRIRERFGGQKRGSA